MATNKLSTDEIFLAAVERSPAERSSYVNEVCGQDADLKARVERLLKAHGSGPAFFESPAPELGGTDFQMVDPPAATVGKYRLYEQIGEGGMGVVYVAEQTEPVKRKVALKIIKPGMASREVIARFEAERQALAMMDHSNIARVFDGGETDSGQPYFVMELVQGVPITDFCDTHELPIRDRLELFLKVCHAVEHAHQKGIIHRDLKPSNMLVSEIDGQPVPKVIDFGVAKAVGEQLIEQTLYTNFAQMVGTPLYMSPEQASLGVLDVDTRSDVYSLGVLLYEILTGQPPFDRDTLKRAGFDEMRRIIREDEPMQPSAKVSTLQLAATTAPAKRHSKDLRQLRHSLRGEIDWIVMRALEKDRARRYRSSGDLALDLKRYLNKEPVEARPTSAFYKIRKLAARNRVAVAASTAVFAALLTGLILASAGYANSRTQLAKTELFADFMRHMYGGQSWGGGTTHTPNRTIRDTLDETARMLQNHEQIRQYPGVKLELHRILARHYRAVQDHARASEHGVIALNLAKKIYGPRSLEVAEVLEFLAGEVDNIGLPIDFDPRVTRDYAQDALDIYRDLGIDDETIAPALFALALSVARDPDQQHVAEAALREAVRLRPDAFTMADLALHLAQRNGEKIDEAIEWAKKAVEASLDENGKDSVRTATIIGMQGKCFRLRGRPGDNDQALNSFESAWQIYRQAGLVREPVGHFNGLRVAEIHLVEHRHVEAEKILKEIESDCRKHGVTDALIRCLFLQGWGHLYRDDFESAERVFRVALQECEGNPKSLEEIAAFVRFYLGRCLLAQGSANKISEAQNLFRQNIKLTTPLFKARTASEIALFGHAWTCLHSGDESRFEEAANAAERALKAVEEWSQECWMPHLCLTKAVAEYRLGKLEQEQAIQTLERGLRLHKQLPTPFQCTSWNKIPATRRELEMTLAQYYLEREGDPQVNLDEAKDVFKTGIRDRIQSLRDERHMSVALAELRYGCFLVEHQQWEEAAEHLKSAHTKLENNPDAAPANRKLLAQKLVDVCIALKLEKPRK